MNRRRSYRPSPTRIRSLVAVCCVLLPAVLAQPLADARPASPVATASHRKKCPEPKIVPCLAPLESEYSFNTGGGEGDLGYLRAKYGKLVRTHREVYVPELRRSLNITTRTVTWKPARSGIEIVAVFKVISPLSDKKRYSVRLRTGRTSGHATLEGPETYNDPSLVIQGRRTALRP
jgi:hypothetical protein